MKEFLCQLHDKVDIGMVGGSDYSKAQEQLGGGDGKMKQYHICLFKPAVRLYLHTFEPVKTELMTKKRDLRNLIGN